MDIYSISNEEIEKAISLGDISDIIRKYGFHGSDYPYYEITTKDQEPSNITNTTSTTNRLLTDLLQQNSSMLKLLASIEKELNTRKPHYDISDTISTAVTSTPQDIDSSSYTRLKVKEYLGKNALHLSVYNDGPGTLYILMSHDGSSFTKTEFPLYEGENKTYDDVYEIRIRSSNIGLKYRITDYDLHQQTAVSKAEKIEIISTDKDVHFTEQITTNNHEKENITGLSGNRFMIRGVNIQSDQPLKYRLIFWSSDGFENTDLDSDNYIDDVELDMSQLPSFRVAGANQYYLNVGGLEIIYEDFDLTRELHISLQNQSIASKNSGGTGEVQIDIKMTPRL